ncbi:glycosyl hydrolase family 28-related protein [Paenibacillus ginsengarvi]|uniref:Uncharacterized protein n=1 Tax=Paenibacillus ginsengarvi TaxID=400777 RepID=A0A3B0AYU2_9BACL|nr:glycosyl hydrolase family 28-related protein [Paenibacillus ginsengarvi]RKN65117.1 hypothetical protein D7M11_33065 [Paenibacillus ginsengarvi]
MDMETSKHEPSQEQQSKLSRRKVLATLGAAGVAIATAGVSFNPAVYAKKKTADNFVVAVNSVIDLLELETSSIADGLTVRVQSVFAVVPGGAPGPSRPFDVSGGGDFIWKSAEPKANHDGGVVISPTVPWNGQLATLAGFLAGTGETAPTGNGCWVRTFGGSINPTWFGAIMDGATDNSVPLAAAIECAVSSGRRSIVLPKGVCATSTSPNFGYSHMSVRGAGKHDTVLKYTGPGRGFQLNGSQFGPAVIYGITVEALTVEGNGAITDLFYTENASHLVVRNVNLREANSATGTAMKLLWTVASTFDGVTCSVNEQPMTNKPFNGIFLGASPSRGAKTTCNTFINPIIEGMTGIGIRIEAADQNTFVGGTSEVIGIHGVVVAPGSRCNTFIGLGFEGNGTDDLMDQGQSTKLINCYSARKLHFAVGSQNAEVSGGLHERIQTDAGASHTLIEKLTVNYWNTSAGGVFDNGQDSTIRDIYDHDTAQFIYVRKPRTGIAVGASPFSFKNSTGYIEQVAVRGGTVTQVLFKRGGDQTIVGGGASGLPANNLYALMPGDELVVSYSALPEMFVIPMG